MKKRIIPAILTDKKNELISMVNLCSEFTDYVQLDFMDGRFVPSKSVTIRDLEGLRLPVKSEAHLMVQNPLDWIVPLKKLSVKKIIFHFEIEEDYSEIIGKIRSVGLKAGLAVNPKTNIDDFYFLVDQVDTVLFMSVNPGFYGAAFIPEVLSKIERFKVSFPKKLVGIDGGMKLSNLKEAAKSGADWIFVGSAIFKENDPKRAYRDLLRLVNE